MILNDYQHRLKSVQKHINVLKLQISDLYKKKQQVENLRLQAELQDKLKVANGMNE